jgi:hypothetical protein
MYQTLLRLGISFVSVGHRSQLKAYHRRLIAFDGTGGFQSQELPLQPHPPQQSDYFLDQIPASNADSNRSGRDLKTMPIDVQVSFSPPALDFTLAFLRMLRLCFTQHGALKNLAVHGLLLLLFIICFINSVVFGISIKSTAQLFEDTSASFIIQYLFFAVIIQALIDAIINSALAYVALRSRKNLTRGIEKA